MIFDTHAHVLSGDLGRYPHAALRGGAKPPVPPIVFPVEQLLAAMDAQGVDRACLVQRATLYGYDNTYMLESAAAHPDRLSPVAVLDAEDPASPAELTRLVRERRLAGLRIVAPRLSEHDTEWLASPQALALWAVAEEQRLPVAVILYRRNSEAGLKALGPLVHRFTGLPIVLDHCGLPHPSTPEMKFAAAQGIRYAIEGAPDFGIAQAIGRFADQAHVHFKVTDINFDRLEDAGCETSLFLRRLADRFGSERIVWGSDAGQSPAPYDDKIARLKRAAGALSPSEREAFLGANAARLYRGAGG